MAYRCRVLTKPDGTVVYVLHPAMRDRTRPRRPKRGASGIVETNTVTTIVYDYDFDSEQVVTRQEITTVPVYEDIHTDDQWAKRCHAITMAKHPEWQTLRSADVGSDALPTDRARRHAWRLRAGAVTVDPTVPDLPHPKQALLNAIDGAVTLSEMKVLLKRIVTG